MRNIVTRNLVVGDLVLAGAIFDEGEIRVIFAIFIVVLVVAAVALVLFLRSLFRLLFRAERTRTDIAVVAVGVLVLAIPTISWVGAGIQQQRTERPFRESAEAAVQTASRIPEDGFGEGRLWQFSPGCDTWIMPVSGTHRGLSADPAPVNQLVRSEAEAFEAAGWKVTRFAPNSSERGTLAFRAEHGDQLLALGEEIGRLAYLLIPASCDRDPAKLDFRGFQVDNF
jgi:hypothetical protein